jgi:hypothetical protein
LRVIKNEKEEKFKIKERSFEIVRKPGAINLRPKSGLSNTKYY